MFELAEDPSGRLHPIFPLTRLHHFKDHVFISEAIEEAYISLRQRVRIECGIIELRKGNSSVTIA